MSNGQRQRGCLVWKRRDWNGTGLGIDPVWHGAGCSLQLFEGLSFGQGIDLLCNVLQNERNMIGIGRKENFGQHMSKYTHCSHTGYHL